MEKVITSLQTSAWLRSVVEWFPLVLFSKINKRTDKPVLCHSCYCYIPYLSIDRTSRLKKKNRKGSEYMKKQNQPIIS